MARLSRNVLMVAAACACSACAALTHTRYVAPRIPMATSWVGAAPTAAPAGRWWTAFGDDRLDALIDRVVVSNNNLAAAAVRLRQARLSAKLAAADLWPSFDANANTTYDGDSRTPTTASRLTTTGLATTHSSSSSVSASWDVDLFGKHAHTRDAAHWEAVATEMDLAETRSELIGATATLYWQLAYANERIEIGQQSIAYAQRSLSLAQLQHEAGATPALDVRDAEQVLATQQADQTQYVETRAETRLALAALLGEQVYDGPDPERLPDGDLPDLAAGLPASILSRRPDLAAAELRLRKALSTADATRASFYPSLTLTGSAGGSSIALLDLFDHPTSAVQAALSLPFLNVERMKLSIGVSQADYDAAVASFRQSVYNALRDVETALSARAQYDAQEQQLRHDFLAAGQAEQLYERRYEAGAIALQPWLDAQERRRTAEGALIQSRLNRLMTEVTLYQSLGGNAETAGAAPAPTSDPHG